MRKLKDEIQGKTPFNDIWKSFDAKNASLYYKLMHIPTKVREQNYGQ
jgi:hypothetical protein